MQFYLQKDDKYKINGRATFKFDSGSFEQFKFLKKLLKQGGWSKNG